VAESGCGFGPFFSLIPRRLGNLLCNGLCHFHGTCNMEA
jgi:hypothetical protein